MMKSKKGLTILFGVVAGIIAALVISLVAHVKDTQQFNVIGQNSLILLKYSNDAEKALFYIDQSSKLALQQSVYELARNGGISDGISSNNCGKFFGYSLWYDLEKSQNDEQFVKSCFDPGQTKDSLVNTFNIRLNNYLEKYPSKISSNYDYRVKEGIEIIGKTNKPISFEIKKE